MPSPRNTAPSPSRNASTSVLNERSIDSLTFEVFSHAIQKSQSHTPPEGGGSDRLWRSGVGRRHRKRGNGCTAVTPSRHATGQRPPPSRGAAFTSWSADITQ